MLYSIGRVDDLKKYMDEKKDPYLHRWWANYCEAKNLLQDAIDHYKLVCPFRGKSQGIYPLSQITAILLPATIKHMHFLQNLLLSVLVFTFFNINKRTWLKNFRKNSPLRNFESRII